MSLQSAQALVVVNGAAGEDADNASPFETLQAAVNFANAGSETVVEIQTNGTIGGMSVQHVTLNHPLTIQAGAGFSPVLDSGLVLIPANTSHSVTLNGLNVSTVGLGTPLLVGCNVTAANCIFNTNPTVGTGAFGPAVTAAIESTGTVSILTMTSCSLRGNVGLQTGRAVRDYVLTKCVVEGVPTDLPTVFNVGISNNMNWFSSFGYRMGTAEGFTEIAEPRTLNLSNSIVRGGVPLGWPNPTLPDAYYTGENSTIGPVTATNTVFENLNINGAGEANRINYPVLPANQNANSTFRHCTFRSANAWGVFYFYGGQPTTYTFSNCLFDIPWSNYGLGLHNANTNVTFAGNGNTYHIPAGVELYPAGTPPFESTEHTYMGAMATNPPLTDSNGNLLLANPAVTAKAVALVPAVTADKHENPRPLPASAARSDIGADEIDETAPAAVGDWSAY